VALAVVHRFEVIHVKKGDHQLSIIESPRAANLAHEGVEARGPAKGAGHLVQGCGLMELLQAAADRLQYLLIEIGQARRQHSELLGHLSQQLRL